MLPRLKRRRSHKGFALVDYLCGTIIMVATLVSVASLNAVKSKTLRFARQRQMAIFCASNLLIQQKNKLHEDAQWNAKAVQKAAEAKDADWAELTKITDDPAVKSVIRGAVAKVQVRPAKGAAKDGFIEMRILVEWRWDVERSSSAQLSTLVKRGTQ
ncbi:MAG: hypothetical protein P1V97_01220 [Planctomycetota bacterium]|nr:hypothetical protein [Planctomycetota bacterium]